VQVGQCNSNVCTKERVSPLLADSVEKVENRTTPKISRKVSFWASLLLQGSLARYDGAWSFLSETTWSLTSTRARRIGGPTKFVRQTKETSSTQSALFGHGVMSDLSPRCDQEQTSLRSCITDPLPASDVPPMRVFPLGLNTRSTWRFSARMTPIRSCISRARSIFGWPKYRSDS